jgi:hypothetical protein
MMPIVASIRALDERHLEAQLSGRPTMIGTSVSGPSRNAATAGRSLVVVADGYVRLVPRISMFYGIVIAMYFDDHPPPHFHAKYGEHQAQVVIATGEVLYGSLPRRALRLVQEWAEIHREELVADWQLAEREEPLVSIDPLP